MKVLITGAVDGLGRALADRLMAAGHYVVALDINREGMHELTQSHIGFCEGHLIDMSDVGALSMFFNRPIVDKYDLVILNAGISAVGKFEDIPAEAYERLIKVNLRAPIAITASLMKNEQIAKGGRVVFISSLSHAVGYPGASVYAATKDGIAVYARAIRKPLRRKGIKVKTVFPGPIRTDHAEKYSPDGSDPKRRMAPDKMAKLILKGIKKHKPEIYPGFTAQMGQMAGRFASNMAMKSMRKNIFEKLDKPKV